MGLVAENWLQCIGIHKNISENKIFGIWNNVCTVQASYTSNGGTTFSGRAESGQWDDLIFGKSTYYGGDVVFPQYLAGLTYNDWFFSDNGTGGAGPWISYGTSIFSQHYVDHLENMASTYPIRYGGIANCGGSDVYCPAYIGWDAGGDDVEYQLVIYKTSDSGTTWTREFSLGSGDYDGPDDMALPAGFRPYWAMYDSGRDQLVIGGRHELLGFDMSSGIEYSFTSDLDAILEPDDYDVVNSWGLTSDIYEDYNFVYSGPFITVAYNPTNSFFYAGGAVEPTGGGTRKPMMYYSADGGKIWSYSPAFYDSWDGMTGNIVCSLSVDSVNNVVYAVTNKMTKVYKYTIT